MGTIIVFVYGGVEIVLLIWAVYLNERLKRYIDKQYPEEGKVIRSYEWQWNPWSVGQKTLRALIKKQSVNDPELANRAKKAKYPVICVFAWPIVFGLTFFCIALF